MLLSMDGLKCLAGTNSVAGLKTTQSNLSLGVFHLQTSSSKMFSELIGSLSEEKSNMPAVEDNGFSVFQARALQ